MSRPIDELRRARVERLAAGLADLEFRSIVVDVDGIASVDEWRAAARLVARRGRWKVATGVNSDSGRVWAVRTDRDVTVEEQRAAIEALSYFQAAEKKERRAVRPPGELRPL